MKYSLYDMFMEILGFRRVYFIKKNINSNISLSSKIVKDDPIQKRYPNCNILDIIVNDNDHNETKELISFICNSGINIDISWIDLNFSPIIPFLFENKFTYDMVIHIHNPEDIQPILVYDGKLRDEIRYIYVHKSKKVNYKNMFSSKTRKLRKNV